MRKIDIIKISPNTSVKEALRIISKGKIQIALVVDKNSKLLGTLTDGDIRNGLLKGLSLDNSIKSIYFKKPTVVTEKVSKKELLKIAISKKINQIPVIDKNKKIIAIHVIDELLEPELKSNKIIIMAGGKGMRLRPLTNEIPKPMLKIGNKPILQILIERFRDNGFKNFIICVNYKSKVITDFFGNGTKYDVNIEYIKEKQRMGTAGALSLIKKKPKEPFFG